MKKLSRLFLILILFLAFVLPVNATYLPDIQIPKFIGAIFYVDPGVATSGTGFTPGTAFKTIGEAIIAGGPGDAITITNGTYDENLTISDKGMELWFEIGVILDPTAGTAITITADSVRLKGGVRITPASGATGMSITGDFCRVGNGGGPTVVGGGTGINITGTGNMISNGACGLQTIANYAISGNQTRLIDCIGVGTGDTSKGYNVTAGALGVFRNCTSTSNKSSSFYLASGVSDYTILNCSSGADDGRWVDVDAKNVFSNFSFDSEKVEHTDWSTIAAGAGSQNLFRVYGVVQILGLAGHVETACAADIGNVKIELYDETDIVLIANNVDMSSVPVGSYVAKEKKANDALVLYTSASARTMVETDLKKLVFGVVAVNDGTDATYIRVTWAGDATSGVIHWHLTWEPLTEEGFVEAIP